MFQQHTDADTKAYFCSLIDNYKHKSISTFGKYTYISLVFGLTSKNSLTLKYVLDKDSHEKVETITSDKLASMKLEGHILTLLYENKDSLSTNRDDYIHINYLPEEYDEEIELNTFSIENFEKKQTQEWILLCLERDKYGKRFYEHQNITAGRLTDIYPQKTAILWSIWLFLQGIFETIPLNKFPGRIIWLDDALTLLYSGIPIIMTYRKRSLVRLTESEIKLISEFDVINRKETCLYSYSFDILFIPMETYVSVLYLRENLKIDVSWDNIYKHMYCGEIGRLYISKELGEIIEDL